MGESGSPQDSSEQVAANDSFSVLGQLQEIPLSATDGAGSSLQISIADVDAAADQARIRRPADSTDADQLVDFLFPLTGVARDGRPLRLFVPWPGVWRNQASSDPEGFASEVGFVPFDVTTFAALEAPPAQFIVGGGVSSNLALPEILPGVRTAGEGDDFEITVGERTAARFLGRPLRIAERDGMVVSSLATTPVVDWLDGERKTLADSEVLANIARRLDEESVVAAMLISEDAFADTGVGLGWEAADEPRGVIVLAYASEAEAQAQLAAVSASFEGESFSTGQPMADLVVVNAIEVRGSEIVATVGFPADGNPRVLLEMLLRRDGPFAQPT